MTQTIDQRFNLKGKVAVVVGGGGLLCSTLARAMLASDMRVAILDVADLPSDLEGKVFYRRCNATSKQDLLAAREEILENFGGVDILLNGAASNAPTPFLEIQEKEIEKILSDNFFATVFACQVFGEKMVAQQKGNIVNFASASSHTPLSRAFIYSAAKAAVASITQNLAREWASCNVRVNALCPGFFPTEWSMKHFIDEGRKNKILGHTPMGRFGKPEELIGPTLWLISEEASFVTGSIVTVDGGFTAMTI